MASSSFTELHQNVSADMSELTKDLERMVEYTEKMSRMASFYHAQSAKSCVVLCCAVLCSPTVQLTSMAHDIVVMRTNPELVSSMQKLEEAYHRCKAAVCGAPKTDNSPVPPAGTHPDWYMIVCPTLFRESLQHLEMFSCLGCFKVIDSCRCFSCYAASGV